MMLYLSILETDRERTFFEEIYRSYRSQMIYVAKTVLKSNNDAEDAVQIAFIGIAKNIETVEAIENKTDLRNYLLKSAKNAALNIIKLRERRNEISFEDEIGEVSDESFVTTVCIKAEYDLLVKALKELDEKYKDVLYYHFVLDLSVTEIASLLDRKHDTVAKQLNRGKKLVIEKLKKEEIVYD